MDERARRAEHKVQTSPKNCVKKAKEETKSQIDIAHFLGEEKKQSSKERGIRN